MIYSVYFGVYVTAPAREFHETTEDDIHVFDAVKRDMESCSDLIYGERPKLWWQRLCWGQGEYVRRDEVEHKLSTSQRKILRIAWKLNWRDHVDDIYVKSYLLNIIGINIYQAWCCMFKAVNGLSYLFITNINIHYHDTRQHSNHHVIRQNTSVRASNNKIFGIKICSLLDTVYLKLHTFTQHI